MNKRRHIVSALVLSGLISACSVGPDYQPPQQILTVNLEESYQPVSSLSTWWDAFNDDQLSNLIQQTLVENRTIVEAAANVDRAYAVFSGSQADRYPDGMVSAGYQASRNASLLSQDDGMTMRGFTNGLSLSWDTDLFGKLKRATQAASARADQAELLWQDARLQIVSQVVSSYGQYRGAQLRLFYAEMNLQFLLQSKEIIQAQINAGSATKLEMTQIDTQIFRVKTDIPAIRIASQTAKSTLAALLATPADSLQISNSATLPRLNQPLSIADNENYLKFRPDVASAERNLAASTAQIGVNTADLYPSLSVSGFLGFISSPGLALNSASESWNIAPTIQWSGLNMGAVQARIRMAEADAEVALAQYEQSVINAVNDMQLSLTNYQQSREQLASAKRQFESSQQAVSISRAQYKAGTVDFLLLLDSERELLTSRDQLAQIELSHFLRMVDVYREFSGAITRDDQGT
ncbi:MAG: efflux transporter outer membrane subunit [Gammaproteobacteria bacterium]|nr:efflux transporter outer membrane subunit [Gammaproteobacteria bacterium]